MLSPKKNSFKEFDDKKNSCSSKIPLPPITFLMVRPSYDAIEQMAPCHLIFYFLPETSPDENTVLSTTHLRIKRNLKPLKTKQITYR